MGEQAEASGKPAEEPTEPEGPQKPKERGGFLTFWTTLPGVLTGIAAVVAAVVSLVALFNPGPDADAAPDPPAAQAPAQGADPAGSAAGVASRGSLTLGLNEYADLADGTVSDSASANAHRPQFFLTGSDGYRLVANSGAAFALVDGSPDRATCVSAVSSRQLGQVALTGAVQGRTICVVTDTQQIGAVTPTSLPAVGSPRVTFDYVVWD